MTDFNLNDPNAFAAITSAFGSVLGPSQDQIWNIVPSSYKEVVFHVFQSPNNQTGPQDSSVVYSAGVPRIQDKTGRRKVLYQFPFKDGQTTGDLGRAPFVFSFEVIFFGPNYFVGYQELYAKLNEPTPGVLRHPVLGDITCVATEWEVIHENTERMALSMRIHFQEHTYDPGLVFQNTPNLLPTSIASPGTFKSAVIAALTAFQAIDSSVTYIRASRSYATSFINGAVNLINGYKQNYLLTLQSLYLSFSPASISLAPDLPGVLPVSLGGNVQNNGTVTNDIYPLTNASQTPFSEVSGDDTATANSILTPIQAQNSVNAVLATLDSIVDTLNGGNDGMGSLDFYEQVLSFKQGGIALRTACLQGIASSKQLTTQFTVPEGIPAMSVREVAFAIGLDVQFSSQITQLNPQLLSVNFIPGGTVLNIPLST